MSQLQRLYEKVQERELDKGIFFFFSSRRRHTRYWRDWSSDVCSSDLGRPGPYQVQAAIAAHHATAAEASATDWAQIAALYGELARLVPSPVVNLNRAVAVAMAVGPAEGLAMVEELEASGDLAGYHLLPATRADLLRRMGLPAEAAAAYRRALGLAATDAERRYLARRLAETTGNP